MEEPFSFFFLFLVLVVGSVKLEMDGRVVVTRFYS